MITLVTVHIVGKDEVGRELLAYMNALGVHIEHCISHESAATAHYYDVNGAGDAFFAGMLYGLQQQLTIEEVCEIGAIAAELTAQSTQTVANIIVTQLKVLDKNEDMKYAAFH